MLEDAPKTTFTEEELIKQVDELEVEDKKKLSKQKDVTQVTNLATETEKSGVKMPSKEELLARAKQDYAIGVWTIANELPKLSKRGLVRVTTAALKIPEEGQKVDLKKEEKRLFGILQRFLNARFTLTLHMVEYEMNLKKQQEQKEKEENKDVPENSTKTD